MSAYPDDFQPKLLNAFWNNLADRKEAERDAAQALYQMETYIRIGIERAQQYEADTREPHAKHRLNNIVEYLEQTLADCLGVEA